MHHRKVFFLCVLITLLVRICLAEHFGISFAFFWFVFYFLCILQVCSNFIWFKIWGTRFRAATCTRDRAPVPLAAGARGHVGCHAGATSHCQVQLGRDRASAVPRQRRRLPAVGGEPGAVAGLVRCGRTIQTIYERCRYFYVVGDGASSNGGRRCCGAERRRRLTVT